MVQYLKSCLKVNTPENLFGFLKRPKIFELRKIIFSFGIFAGKNFYFQTIKIIAPNAFKTGLCGKLSQLRIKKSASH